MPPAAPPPFWSDFLILFVICTFSNALRMRRLVKGVPDWGPIAWNALAVGVATAAFLSFARPIFTFSDQSGVFYGLAALAGVLADSPEAAVKFLEERSRSAEHKTIPGPEPDKGEPK